MIGFLINIHFPYYGDISSELLPKNKTLQQHAEHARKSDMRIERETFAFISPQSPDQIKKVFLADRT